MNITAHLLPMALVTLAVISPASAQQSAAPSLLCPVEALVGAIGNIRAALPSTTIDSVNCTPVPGIYEVIAGQNVLYISGTGGHMFVGRLYDVRAGADLTAPVQQRLNPVVAERSITQSVTVRWEALPPAAVRWGDPKGLKVGVFGDPNCGFCQRLHAALADIKADVHEFALPIMPAVPDRGITSGLEKWQAVWCATDRAAALQQAYTQATFTGPRDCTLTGLDLQADYARAQGWTGTPVIVREDGAVQFGFKGTDALADWLMAAR